MPELVSLGVPIFNEEECLPGTRHGRSSVVRGSLVRRTPGGRQARAAPAESLRAHPPRKTISPWLGSYGDTAMVTRSPGITRMW